MPRRGEHSGLPCTAYHDATGALCEPSAPGAVRCAGRMFPLDVVHPIRRQVIDGAEVEVEDTKIIRYRRCSTCFARTATREMPFGPTTQGPSIGAMENETNIVSDDDRPTLFDREDYLLLG